MELLQLIGIEFINQKTNKVFQLEVLFPWPDEKVPTEDNYRNNKKQKDKKK